ncbi:hypothetical protein CERZMDRAFT_96057 [Cercospora zeae-maydis SCOH1-5]|uniref:Uncharacterized protein n=1 Tax=Cercospora zeae-maydis SCOH1-5 TaxID=717836 RepID=A0A6A6FKX7_9PEZI|nr:hypothetical protein CERZMDRAFT_96057 [Cercospora zeae-maydis SCOH1-5]
MKSPTRADTFGSENSASSTSSKLTWRSTFSPTNKNHACKTKKLKAQTVQFSDVGRHSNQWLFNNMSISDAVKAVFGKKFSLKPSCPEILPQSLTVVPQRAAAGHKFQQMSTPYKMFDGVLSPGVSGQPTSMMTTDYHVYNK